MTLLRYTQKRKRLIEAEYGLTGVRFPGSECHREFVVMINPGVLPTLSKVVWQNAVAKSLLGTATFPTVRCH